MDPVEITHSLPSPEEVRTEMVGNPHSGKHKRRVALIAICVMTLSLIIGFSAAIAQKKRADRNSSKDGNFESVESKAPPVADWNPDGPDQAEDASLINQRAESRLQQVIEFLSVRISLREHFDNPTTPQYKAALWIADQDFAKVDIPADPNNYDDDFEFVQRYIMAVFYFALDGANWTYKAYFMSDYEVCQWNMDFIEQVPGQEDASDDWMYGVQCGDNGAISTIFMTGNGLKGELPGELGDLLDLDHLSLFGNAITGGIPDRFQFLTDLDFLNLENNEMSGKLPAWMGSSWLQLEFLDLGGNAFSGPIPDLTGLDYLTEIALDRNQLSGNIDAFSPLISAETLFLNNNKFVGYFGDESWPDLDSLDNVDLSNNYINGSIPTWAYNLITVDLHNNYMNGTIPEVPDDSDFVLQYLAVFDNDLRGTIPDSIGDLDYLYHLDLSDNFLTGTIPEEFYYLENLEVLYLSDNDLGPQPFPDLSQSIGLRELGLADSRLTGQIPHWVARTLPDLVVLNLRDNQLTGTIPPYLGQLQNIKYLFLNYNSLAGPVPDFSSCKQLVQLFIDNNKMNQPSLTGSLQSVCDAGLKSLNTVFVDSVITCSCCQKCQPGQVQCNWWDKTFRLTDTSPRDQYLFDENKVFTTESTEPLD